MVFLGILSLVAYRGHAVDIVLGGVSVVWVRPGRGWGCVLLIRAATPVLGKSIIVKRDTYMEVLYRGGQSEGFDNLYVFMCASRLGYVV